MEDNFEQSYDNDLYGDESLAGSSRNVSRDFQDSARRPPSQPTSSRAGSARPGSKTPASKMTNKTRPLSANKKNVK